MSGEELGIFEDGGFVAVNGDPRADAPRDWMVWHFTPTENLPGLIAEGGLCCDDDAPEQTGSVANQDVKAGRRARVVAADGYPLGRMVSSHVPFYIAARSPMLYVVERNNTPAKLDSLVFLGVRIGDVIDAGLEWVASDGNARADITRFSTDIDNLGTFIDFDLMKGKWWNNVPDDMDRMRRRAAEFLVHSKVPLSVVSHVIARTDDTLNTARQALTAAGNDHIDYHRSGQFYALGH